MWTHPHPDVVAARPALLDQAPLGLDGGGDGVVELGNAAKSSSPCASITLPPVRDGLPDDAADAVQDRRVVRSRRVNEGRRALDVAEEEGDLSVSYGAHR